MKRLLMILFAFVLLCFQKVDAQQNNVEQPNDAELVTKGKAGDPAAQMECGDIEYGNGNYAEAVQWIMKAAEQGYAQAENSLGYCYFSGKGVVQNYTEAIKWYRKAAEQGYAQAEYNLGDCYKNGNGVSKNLDEAYKWYKRAADNGFEVAQYVYGDFEYDKENYAEAVQWFKKAAEQGYTRAEFHLGYCYYSGKGVAQNYTEAVKWYQKAAEQGHALAEGNLGECYKNGKGVSKDLDEAIKWFKRAADKGDEDAQYQCGKIEYDRENYAEAVQWFMKAAEQGNSVAEYWLGDCYKKGNGVAKDLTEAYKWYKRAADKGDEDAQYECGEIEYDKENYVEAVQWYKKAAEKDEGWSEYSLGACYRYGRGVTRNYTEAIGWYKKAAEHNIKFAIYALGEMYQNGEGTTKNLQVAKEYYKKAADLGYEKAKVALENLSSSASSAAGNMVTKIGPKKSPEFINKEFSVRHPINIVTDGGSNNSVVEAGSYVDVKLKKCPKGGNCIIFNIHFVEDGQAYDLTFSWSGANTNLMDLGLGYIPVRGSLMNPKGSGTSLIYVPEQNKWVLTLGRNCNWIVGAGLKEGMTRQQVSKELSGSSTPGRFTEGTQCGNLTLYGFKSYAMERQYHINGDYHYNATTKNYLDLYFDANGKLDRWCTNF